MAEKLVSAIITTYGRGESFILEAIESVRKQTYKKIEIIVIDDNGIGTELQKRNEKRIKKEDGIRYFANKVNRGAQVSRNIGILVSNGEYIACLDDDDIWAPDKIKKQVELMEKENLALVFCNGYRFYNNDLKNKKLYQFNFVSDCMLDFFTELKSDCIGSTSIPLIKKKCFAQTGLFDVDMPARQDYEMWLRFCKFFRVKGINEPLFYYRYHSGDRITQSYRKEIESYQILRKKYKADYKKDNIARANILFTVCRTYFKSNHFVNAIIFFIKAMFSSPNAVIQTIVAHYNKKAQF